MLLQKKNYLILQKIMLKIAFVDRAFNAPAPKISVTAKPRTRYITIIEAP